MTTFLESICFKDGTYPLINYHQERVNRTFHHFFPEKKAHQLSDILPRLQLDGLYKVRMIYTNEKADIEFSEYKIRTIKKLQLMESNEIEYSYKYEERSTLNELVESSTADDVIIVKNGLITDSSYSNLVFWNGMDWITPENPLLEGTRRAQLLSDKKIKKAPIKLGELSAFQKVSLINAMMDLGSLEISIQHIY